MAFLASAFPFVELAFSCLVVKVSSALAFGLLIGFVGLYLPDMEHKALIVLDPLMRACMASQLCVVVHPKSQVHHHYHRLLENP